MSQLDAIQASLNTFTKTFQSLVISSITKDGKPYASYAPFVHVDGTYYILISKIAKHYQNILNHPQISILFIEDESKAEHIFFRKRLSYVINTQFEEKEVIKEAFIHRFGDFVKRLFLMDFVMIKCHIVNGHYIIGPGQAYMIDQHQQVLTTMKGANGKGHQHT